MPRGDRKGPLGFGPMTGRALGFCAGYGGPGYANPGIGRGWLMGFRNWLRCGSFGWRHRFYATGVPGWLWWGSRYSTNSEAKTEKQFLEEQLNLLQQEVDAIKNRLAKLDVEKD